MGGWPAAGIGRRHGPSHWAVWRSSLDKWLVLLPALSLCLLPLTAEANWVIGTATLLLLALVALASWWREDRQWLQLGIAWRWPAVTRLVEQCPVVRGAGRTGALVRRADRAADVGAHGGQALGDDPIGRARSRDRYGAIRPVV